MNKIGVGPHPQPWPEADKYDRDLLENGDSRNVVDRYRYQTVEAIKQDLALRSHEFEIAVENWQHDFNIGTIVRNANAFGARRVHIIGRRHWNRRGAMKTETYLEVVQHQTIDQFLEATNGKALVGIDNIEGSSSLGQLELPQSAVFVFGGEGPGLSKEMVVACQQLVKIDQYGSTRSVNVGVASGIIMYEWLRQHKLIDF